VDMNRLKTLRLASPFKPFYLLTSDGQRYVIDQPYHLGMAPDASRIGVVAADASVRLLWPQQVVDVDLLPDE
jgi:hypothetical protein